MNKIAVLAVAAVLATTGGVAYAASAPTMAVRGSTQPAHIVLPKGKALVNQTTGGAGIGIVSQNFSTTFSVYDSADADAFTVPSGSSWKVSSVVAAGTYFNGSGPATSENVIFYSDKKGAPGTPVKKCSFTGVKGKDSSGTFTIALPGKGCKLKAGTYWVSVIANLPFSAGGEWGWNDATDTGPHQADWENPGGGFGVCPTWAAELTCIPDGQANGKNYELFGKG